jgi:hypothetical protein
VSEGELRQRGWGGRRRRRRAHRRDQPPRRDHPADVDARRHRPAHRAEQRHPVGVAALQHRQHRRAEAELGVVVVFGDDAAAAPRPLQQAGAAARRERGAGRDVVRRADAHRAQRRPGRQVGDHEAVVVGRQRDEFQPGQPGRLPQAIRPGLLHPELAVPVRHQRPGELGHARRGAGENGDGGGGGGGRAPPAEVLRQDRAQPGFATLLGVAELVERRGLGRLAHRLEPLGARERAEVRAALGQVVAGRVVRPDRPRDRAVTRVRRPAHPGRGAGARRQVPLGDELAVRPRHGPAGNPQIRRQHPAGRQRRPQRQPTVPDRRPDGRRQPDVQRPGPGGGQVEQHLPRQIGLRLRHSIGS